MSLELFFKILPNYLHGVWVTIQLLFISVFIGFFFSIVLSNLKNTNSQLLKKGIGLFTYYFRGTPLLIQIFLIYYGSGQFEWLKNSFLWYFFEKPYFCAILALILNNTAYTTEIFYNAIKTTDTGEIEAAEAFGMNRLQKILYIITPSALRRSIPAYSNEFIFMLHATSLVSVITIMDITGVAKVTNARYFIPFHAFILAAILYSILSYICIQVFKKLEKKYLKHLNI